MTTTEKTIIDHTCLKWIWTYCNNQDEVNEVVEYLKNNDLKIEITSYREYSNVILEGVDLSVNGACFSRRNLLNHVRYYRKFREEMETDSFKEWYSKYPKYELIVTAVIEGRWFDEKAAYKYFVEKK